MIAAPVRWPRPSRLEEPLPSTPAKLAGGLQALGLSTVGELIEHLPTASREARTVAALRADEQATVAVRVQSIGQRSVRRRGMRPLVQARVLDATGSMRATFFNQPWLLQRYPPGTHLLLHGKADGRGGFRVSHHAIGSDIGAELRADPEAVAHYPAAEGISSTQILTLVRAARDALGDVTEPLSAATRVAEGLPGPCQRAGRDALSPLHRRPRERACPAGVRGAAADTARLPAPPRKPRGRAPARSRWTRSPR